MGLRDCLTSWAKEKERRAKVVLKHHVGKTRDYLAQHSEGLVLRKCSLQMGVLRRASSSSVEPQRNPWVSESLGCPGVRRHTKWRENH